MLQIKNKFASGTYESGQLQRFVKAWNEQIAKSGGSMTRRSPTSLENKASAAWKKVMQKLYPQRFKGKVVGHTPDAAAGGPSAPSVVGLPAFSATTGPQIRAMALAEAVNQYLAGILKGIPKGTRYHKVVLVS